MGAEMILSFKEEFIPKIENGTKIHTIREDPARRWRPKMKIHFATGFRTPRYRQFSQGVCKSIQEVCILPSLKEVHIQCPPQGDEKGYWLYLYETDSLLHEFAKNDGFESPNELFEFFGKTTLFRGRLIHWTDFLYTFPEPKTHNTEDKNG